MIKRELVNKYTHKKGLLPNGAQEVLLNIVNIVTEQKSLRREIAVHKLNIQLLSIYLGYINAPKTIKRTLDTIVNLEQQITELEKATQAGRVINACLSNKC